MHTVNEYIHALYAEINFRRIFRNLNHRKFPSVIVLLHIILIIDLLI